MFRKKKEQSEPLKSIQSNSNLEVHELHEFFLAQTL